MNEWSESGRRAGIPGRVAALIGVVAVILPMARAADDPPGKGDRSRWVRELPGGVVVEFLGVCDPHARPAAWWGPDGVALADPIADPVDPNVFAAGRQDRNLAVRVGGPGAIPDVQVRWDLGPDFASTSGTALKGGKPVPGVNRAAAALPYDRLQQDVRLRVAATAWTTVATRRRVYQPGDEPRDGHVHFSQDRPSAQGTTIVVAHDYRDRDAQVVAVAVDGKVHYPTLAGGNLDAPFRVHDLEFSRLRPDQIDRFELQVRPIATAEFVGIPLKPRSP